MPRYEYKAKGTIALPHPFAGVAVVPQIITTIYHNGTIEAPDVNAARVMARKYCERVLGMSLPIITNCWLETRKAE